MSTMNSGDVSRRIGVPITSDLLKELGFKPVGQDKRATLWAEKDFKAMCVSLANWIKERQTVPMQPKPVTATKVAIKTAVKGAAAQAADDEEL